MRRSYAYSNSDTNTYSNPNSYADSNSDTYAYANTGADAV